MRTDISKVKVYVRVKPYLETNKDIDDLAIDILSDKKIVINLLEKYYIYIYIFVEYNNFNSMKLLMNK